MVSVDRQTILRKAQWVHCPLRDRPIPIERCLACTRLAGTDRERGPRFIVCGAGLVIGSPESTTSER